MSGNQEIAVVTGGARGIGLATVRRLAQDGFCVHAVDRSRERLEQSVSALRSEGLQVSGTAIDVTDERAMVSVFEALPRVDAVIAAAGIFTVAPIEKMTVEEFRQVVDVNLTGVFLTIREAVRRMQPGGRIVAVSSRSVLGDRSLANYIASKAGIIGLVRAVAVEMRPRLIAVNAIAPGFTDTELVRELGAERIAAMSALEPRGHPADPAEIAHAIAFLVSPQTRFITGQTLFVDGGKSLGGFAAAI
jgi:3-oxoacyl-[acyl-carrier protein] reductase